MLTAIGMHALSSNGELQSIIPNCQIKTSPTMWYFYTQTHTLTLCACILSIPIVNYLQNGMISRVQSTLVELCYQCLLTLLSFTTLASIHPTSVIYYVKASESATPVIYCSRWLLHSGTNFRLIAVSRFYNVPIHVVYYGAYIHLILYYIFSS